MSAECQICNKTFTKRGLPSHIRQKHPATDDLIDSVLKEPETINSKPKNPEKNAGSESKNADKSIKLQQQESEKAVDSQPKESESKTNDLHWLDISTEDGTVISYNVRHKRSQKGYYKLDESSGKFIETDFDESAEWFRVTCKYCGGNFNKWNLRKHYIEAHLQANKKNATFPNIFNIQSTSFAGTLPSSDSWPIDFSLVVQDDALLKYDKISYSSFFTTDSNFESSNELLKCFKYSVDTEHLNNSYSFNYTCPLCNEKFACVSVNLMKLVALVHLRVRHRDDRLLVKMCEDEIKYFNKAFGTNFVLFVELKHGPRLPTDLLLCGPEADFIRENAYGDYDVCRRFYPCKLCLTYYSDEKLFKKHLSQIHSFGKIAVDYYYPTFVQPNQIDIDSSNLRLNSSYPLTFTKKDDEYLWCCHLCGKAFRDSEIGYLFAKIGVHILTKKLSYKNISKSYALLTQCASFSQMQIYYETLQWNSLQYQRVFNSISATDETIKRRCPFCSKNYFLPKLLNDDSAEILHILVDHDGIGNDSLLLRYIIGSPSVGDNFPFLDVLFGDTLDRKASERRLRCKKCLTVFKNYHELLIHGRIHVSNHQIDPARYFFALPAESINILLSKLIDGVSTYDKFPKYDYAICICTTCLQIMNPNGCINFARMIEHIKSCQYNEPSISIDELPMAFKETKFRIWTFPPSLCSICEKQYVTAFAAKQCCTIGQPLSIFTKKRSIATKSATEPAEKRKVDIVDFVFKTF